MKKAEILQHWQDIEPDQTIVPTAVQYKHRGSTYACDGIRITGSQQFIDSVLSRIKDLLDYENDDTRLQLNYQESHDRGTGEALGSYNCYIQVHERGREARIMNTIFGGKK